MPGTPNSNMSVAKKLYEAFNSKNKALLDLALSPSSVDVPLAPGQGPGRQGLKDAMEGYFASFPNLFITNEAFIATGNTVVVRSTIRANQRGEFASVGASGRPVQVMAIDIHELCGGLITRTWHVEDWLSGLFQIGALPLKK